MSTLRRPRAGSVLLLLPLLCLAAPTLAAESPTLATEPVVTGLTLPTFVTSIPGDDRLFVLEQTSGLVRIVQDGQIVEPPFLDVSDQLTAGGERGLLGLAFHPRYRQNGRFFVDYNDLDGNVRVEEFQVDPDDPDRADPTSGQVLLTIQKPFIQHNGGMLAFGPHDGYLYVSIGDGGSGGDPGNNAQDLSTLLGNILRLDVDRGSPYAIPPDNPFVGVPGAREEIFAYGLRNPWRFGIDALTGDLYVGDVGQESREEIDWLPESAGGGQNLGWRCVEGSLCTGKPECTCPDEGFTAPVYEYDHDEGCAVMGGTVYRGRDIAGLQGTYFFADYCTSRVWSFRLVDGAVTELVERTTELAPLGGSLNFPTAFGVDGDGELLIVSYAGTIYRVVEAAPAPDCDGDGVPDADELAAGTAFDVNRNGTPDDCELLLTVGDVVLGGVTPIQFIGATPGQTLAFFTSFRTISEGPCFFQGTICLDIAPPVSLLLVQTADEMGQDSFDLPIPPGPPPDDPAKILFQVILVNGLQSQKSNPVQKVIQGS